MSRWIFILSLIFLWACPAWAVLYKWQDENGSTHFTDDITKVPLKYRPHPTNKKKKTERPETRTPTNFKKKGAAPRQKMNRRIELTDEEMRQEMEKLAEELIKVFGGMGEEYKN